MTGPDRDQAELRQDGKRLRVAMILSILWTSPADKPNVPKSVTGVVRASFGRIATAFALCTWGS